MRELFFEDNIDDGKYCGQLYGLGSSYIQNGTNSTPAYSGQYGDDISTNNNSTDKDVGGTSTSSGQFHDQKDNVENSYY
jgi:hypothetical protein